VAVFPHPALGQRIYTFALKQLYRTACKSISPQFLVQSLVRELCRPYRAIVLTQ